MFKMGLGISDRCTNCRCSKYTRLHALWLCPPVLQFWTDITKKLTEFFKIPALPLRHLLSDISQMNPSFKYPMPLLMFLAIAKKNNIT